MYEIKKPKRYRYIPAEERLFVVCKKMSHAVLVGVYSTLKEAREVCTKKNKGDYYGGAYGVFEAIDSYHDYLKTKRSDV